MLIEGKTDQSDSYKAATENKQRKNALFTVRRLQSFWSRGFVIEQ